MTKRKKIILISSIILIGVLYIFFAKNIFLRLHFYFNQKEYSQTLNTILDLTKDNCNQDLIINVLNPANNNIKIQFECWDTSHYINPIRAEMDKTQEGTYITFPKQWNFGAGSGESCTSGIIWSNAKDPFVQPWPGVHTKLNHLKENWYTFRSWYPGKC